MNADSRVREFFPSIMSREESDASVDRINAHFSDHGFGLWALEVPGVTPFAGFVGLAHANFDAHFTPCVEIGWRLAVPYWHNGYATEAARASLTHGFDVLQLTEIVALTAVENLPSRRVMERIGMTRDPADDFNHPSIARDHPLSRCVLYRISAPQS
jgi:RimJ/RimL family protein N-acetyltransferase